MSITIITTPAKAGRFHASISGRHVGTFRTPLLSAARALLRDGVDPSTAITLLHSGATFDALRSTVGVAAKLTVKEDDAGRQLPHFVPYRAFAGHAVSAQPRRPSDSPSLHRPPQHRAPHDFAEIAGTPA
ncbi:hypothetical protein AB4037_08390 [Labrys sp. KB_33_2]|uniref:hypothetical protein n=1 Tax=Labrys sp. KB_33_2 TaxID=3237479 RepID=UPI003F8F36FB